MDTSQRGWTLKPNRTWDGKIKDFEAEVDGDADSNYATCVDTRRSVIGLIARLFKAIIAVKSGM